MHEPVGKMMNEEFKTMLICVESYRERQIIGTLYHASNEEGKPFRNAMQMIMEIDSILESMSFPKSSLQRRSFARRETEEKKTLNFQPNVSNYKERRGELATFKLRVTFKQNASWQGILTWVESETAEAFRSLLEMLMLMDSALYIKEKDT